MEWTLALGGIIGGAVNFFINYLNLPLSKPKSASLLSDEWPQPRSLWLAILGYLVVGIAGGALAPLLNEILEFGGYDDDEAIKLGYAIVFGYGTSAILNGLLSQVLKRLERLEADTPGQPALNLIQSNLPSIEQMNWEALTNLEENIADRMDEEASLALDQDEVDDIPEPVLFESKGKLAVVVGHTKNSPGALGVSPISAHEYKWNKEVADLVKAEASAQDLDCKIFFRDVGGIAGVYKRVETWKADLSVELHFNSFSSNNIRGTEAFYGVESTTPAKSKTLAKTMQEHMIKLYGTTGRKDRGIKGVKKGDRGGKSVNSMKSIPSCLLEPFFGNNAEEAKLGNDKKSDYAKMIVTAALDFL